MAAIEREVRIIHNYAPQIIPVIPCVLKKVDKKDWNSVIRIIGGKHKIIEKRSDIISPEVENFVDRFMNFLSNKDAETVAYCIGELSRVEQRIISSGRRRIANLESIILDSVERRYPILPQNELSKMHDLFLGMDSYGRNRSSQALACFAELAECIGRIPAKFRAQVIDYAGKILNHEFKDEDARRNILEKKDKLLVAYARAAEQRIPVLREGFSNWINVAMATNPTISSLKGYLEDKHSYFGSDLELAVGGLPLSQIHGRVLAYVQALTGKPIKVEKSDSSSLSCSFDGETFFLPPVVNVGKNDEDRFRIYKALASYQAGAFMFGTYNLDLSKIDLKTAERFGDDKSALTFFTSFKNPEFARALFELLEFSRLDYRLGRRFPGLREDLSSFNSLMASDKGQLEDLTPAIKNIRGYVFEICSCSPQKRKGDLENILDTEISRLRNEYSSVEKTIEAVARAYKLLEKKYDLSVEQRKDKMIDLDIEIIEREEQRDTSHLVATPEDGLTLGKRFRYREWSDPDNAYKEDFVQVVETDYPDVQDNNYVLQVLQRDHAAIERMRRTFESLSPEEFQRVTRQLTGNINYDLLVRARAEQIAGITPSEKIYTRDYKNQRSVTSLVLAENSGSLRKFLDVRNPDMRIIDVIKHAQIYFSEALEAIGDDYALATFSGETERNVEFYLIKDFHQPYDANVRRVIGGLRPLKQNRDAAGLRHATTLLTRQPEKTRLLFYLMEGLPHDFGYKGSYAIADTRKAIIEAKQRGCLPVVIASGREINQEVRSLADHCIYREVDDPRVVPELLPNIYRRIAI